MILLLLQIISSMTFIAYCSVNIYVVVKHDSTNTRIMRYAWYHVRDKWTGRISKAWSRGVHNVENIFGLYQDAAVPLNMVDFTHVEPSIETEEIISVNGKNIIII